MFQDNFFRELVIDNFAGGGGASTGMELAIGAPVDIAVNHNPDAIAMHSVNHPFTLHFQEDVFAITPEDVTGGRPVGVAWFSPDCTHFSRAKGNKPVSKKVRGLSWVILKWAMSKSAPRVIFMENVPEIQTWCPTIKNDKGEEFPDLTRSGETFNGFIAMLSTGIDKSHPAFSEACEFLKIEIDSEQADKLSKGLGYDVEWRELKACDYGAPTIRKRFYLVARRDGKPIVFPAPTHGKGKGLKPYRTAAECIDWSIPCPSIFDRKKPLVANTLRRIARGLDKFIIKNPQPFIMQMNYDNAPQNINQPLSTETTVNHHFMVFPYISKYFSGEKQAGADIQEPMPSVTAVDHNALVAANIIHYYGGDDHASAPNSPLPTVTVKPRHYLAESHLMILRNNMDCKGMGEPMPTITARAGHEAHVKTYFEKVDSTINLGNWDKVRRLLNEYAGRHIADDEVLIFYIDGQKYFIADIGMRMLRAFELMRAQGFPDDYIIDIETKIGKPYSESKQIARMGNAVCPPVASAIVRANVPEMCGVKHTLRTMAELNAEIGKTVVNSRRKAAV